MKKSLFFINFIIFVIITLSVIQVIVSNSLSTKGVLLSQLEDEIRIYKKENSLIREKVLVMSSFTNIASKAGELGFAEDKSQIVLTPTLLLAVRQ